MPKEVADHLESMFVKRGCDGFVVAATHVPGAYADFVRYVIPELQRRGLYHQDYTGATLRENLGLPQPDDRRLEERASGRGGGVNGGVRHALRLNSLPPANLLGHLSKATVSSKSAASRSANGSAPAAPHALADVKIEVPLIPRTFYCAGLNYVTPPQGGGRQARRSARTSRPGPRSAIAPRTRSSPMTRTW